jgi:hypothetical protein
MQKLEEKLVTDFRQLGQRAIEESTAVIGEQINNRIENLEQISAMQSETLLSLRDTTRIAEQKVSAVVNSIEKSLTEAVPGFQIEAPKLDPVAYAHPQFQLEAPKAGKRAEQEALDESLLEKVFCPKCTSLHVRRSHRSGLLDQIARLFLLAPYRCRACRHKFYRV